MLNLLNIYKNEFSKTKKSLGQHFLINQHYIEKILDAAYVSKDSRVLEIGPGCGALTVKILERGADLTAIEIDAVLVDFLKRYLHFYPNFKIIHSDFTKIDKSLLDGRYNVVGNLPYYVSVPILEKCTELIENINTMTFMFQKEVADRIISTPSKKSYSSLSVFCQYFFDIKKIFNISGGNFWPTTKVESTVLHFIPKKRQFDMDEKDFLNLVKLSFSSKRKMLKNNLHSIIDTGLINEFFKRDNVRAEELSVEDFINFYNFLKNAK
ncbi:16S rRNA (adenine(1518)-N(6)/adenine(1519)-N(6))-dimethyltransferase RsmA [Calditerrivibrio nitroreducens]|uniref:Ribosomal RNA small subunit methyltransferase A n=1 Tax=Calditerrivibrio nitroreducens (strain DSM 19672 / NBRC 101217 / Yu37-1) TaxID=768670 RepID=E4TGS2_CALNY|nr:16S rRNA (adenine(1518)-N(6)/adenine(1519)-N(6))-dimethyltransferase RsmA [Calditerrivibrio nitroreducens]ADR18682.1 dimethyladenosine transferase [Calditerrivibrio nitroreducens DSM 19672]